MREIVRHAPGCAFPNEKNVCTCGAGPARVERLIRDSQAWKDRDLITD